MDSEILKANSLKNTPSRKAVLEVLEQSQGPLTAEEVYRRILSKGERTCLSTVYRTLSTLSQKGLLLRSASQDGSSYFQLRGSSHRHYLICTQCGSTVPICGCPLEELEKTMEQDTGFSITGHNLELYGLCPDCAKCGKGGKGPKHTT